MSFIKKRKRLVIGLSLYALTFILVGWVTYSSIFITTTTWEGVLSLLGYLIAAYVSILLAQLFIFAEIWKIGTLAKKVEALELGPPSEEYKTVSDEAIKTDANKRMAALISRGVEDIKKYRRLIPFGLLYLAVYFSPSQLYERLVLAAILTTILNSTQEAKQ